MYVAIEGRAAGLLGVADPIKESAREAIAALRAEGLAIVMLTGDNRVTAEAVARKLGIEEVVAEVLPDREGQEIVRLQEAGHAGGDGRRRHQRRPRPGPGRRGHRDGDRDRHRHGERRR